MQGSEIPIYGMPSFRFGRESFWSDNVTGLVNITSQVWQGGRLPEFDLQWKLVIGVTVPTADEMLRHMTTWQQLVSPRRGGGDSFPLPPQPVQLIVGEMVNCKGVMLNAFCNGEAPYYNGVPVQTTFTGTFRFLPSYDGNFVNVTKDKELVTAEAMEGRLYRV